MTLAALCVNVPFWSIIGLNFHTLIFTLSTTENLCVLAEAFILAGLSDAGKPTHNVWNVV